MSDPGNILEVARGLVPAVRDAANEIERERKLPKELVEAFRSAGLFHLFVPADYGGLEVHPSVACRVIEEISAADGSAGWCVMIAAQNAAFSGFISRESAIQVYGNRQIVAGVARPIGRAIEARGGFSVSGRWPFCSGSSHADWLAAESVIYDGDKARTDADGNTPSYMMFAPRSAATIHDTWNTTGLRGTASHDFSLSNAQVPAHLSMRMLPEQVHPWAFYRSLAVMFATHGAQALGVARATVEAGMELARTKVGWGTTRPLAEQPQLQGVIAEAYVLVEAAAEHMHGSINRLWDAALKGEDLGPLNSRVRLATSNAASASVRAVDLVHDAFATTAIFQSSPLERRFRDIHTASAHVMISRLTYEAAGRVELGLEAGMPFF
jgi:alkylation response protein AidB-like acyl-CoA dehydrogenase